MFVKAVIRWLKIGLPLVFAFTPGRLAAQFQIGNHPFQVHGFVTQGFAYSDQNNYLTMPTSNGSFAMTDAGLNVSTQINDKFRVGAQAYVRRIGELGNGRVTIDWAEGEYRFTDWLGIRAGRVKTVLGLFNSTQDMEFLHTWALLPQSMYPLDLREMSLSHLGGDVFGNVHAGKLGTFAYTVYAGKLAKDFRGGYDYGDAASGIYMQEMNGDARGADLRLTTSIPGLMVGTSVLETPNSSMKGFLELLGTPVQANVPEDTRTVYYGQYTRGNLTLNAEYSRQLQKIDLHGMYSPFGIVDFLAKYDRRAWYASASYRISKHLELGTYHSRYFPNADRMDGDGFGIATPPERHIFDQTVAARLDLTNFWDLKIEEHFINGFGDASSFHGFYPQDNPNGIKPRTNLFILRMGVNF